nr:serine protease ami-like [Danaus plexippus plexippus]
MTNKTDSVIIIAILLSNLYFISSRRVKRVVGGIEVPCGSQDQIASLRNATTSKHLCGTVVLTRKVAVTAAHCVMHASNSYIIHLNNYCVKDAEGTPRSRVLDIIRHPLYNESSKEHDIALLRLQLYLDDITWLNVLPYSSFGISGGCVFYGYGYYDEKEVPSQTLRAAALELMSLDKCTELLGKYVAPEPNSGMLCASGNGADACLVRLLQLYMHSFSHPKVGREINYGCQ